ncbi:MAG: choice-of-anchor V domain-containing protein [Bacteroidota bacterium]
MKIKINSVYVLFVIGVISYLSIARSANPPNGRTGAPGDGLCIDCHSGGGTFDGETIITGLPDMIEPSTTYPITVTVTNPNGAASRAGFQLVALDNSNLNAGTFSNAGPDSDVENSGGRDYWEHRPAVFFPASNEVSWTIDWQAPASPPMEVITFYAAGLIANGSGAGNDRMELATASGTLGGMADPLVVTVSTTPAECFGDANGSATANVDGGTGPFSYSWSNGGNTQTISNLEAGNYSVTVTDMLMESDNDSDAVTEPSEIMTNVTITPVACNGESTGSIELGVSGGNNSFTFQWNNGANTEDLVNVPAGSYSVTITDMPNCQVILSNLDVTEPSMELSADFDISDVQCNGGADGEITANPSGGTPPYIYEWSTGSTDPTIEDLNEGTYSLTITDNNDCEAIFDVDIVQPMELTASIDIIDVRCNGEENGEIAVTPSGGTPPYLYAWSNGASTQNLTDIGPGSYNLTITDANNCTQEFTNNVVQEPAVLEAGADAMNESAPGANDGSASAFPAGGTSPYFYLWSNGENTETINNLPSGPYTVTVTDNKNCIAIETVVVQAGNCDIAVEVNTVDATCVDATNGSAAAIVTGGTSPFRYAWSTGDTTEMIDNLAPGNYSVTVTDAGNCIVVNSNSVNINDTESQVAMPLHFHLNIKLDHWP